MKSRYHFIITVTKASGRFHTSRMTMTGKRCGPMAADLTPEGSLGHFLVRMKYWSTEDFIMKD